MIAILYYPQFNGKLPLTPDLWITGVALAGALVGQVGFGLMGDYLGRRKVYLITLFLIIGATIGQALAASTVKGDYPLSATIMCEYANKKWRGSLLAAVFAAQGFGIISGAIVSLAVMACFQSAIKHTSILYLDYVWRIIIGLGCVPAVATIYLRAKLPETPRFTVDVAKDLTRADKNMAVVYANRGDFQEPNTDPDKMDRISWRDLKAYLTSPSILRNRNFWVLFGTASTWFFVDIAFYSQAGLKS
ncbi:TPA: Proton phosphate symporter [Trebouxia sp. C0004]